MQQSCVKHSRSPLDLLLGPGLWFWLWVCWLYVGALALVAMNPVSASGGDLQNGNRRPNFFWASHNLKVDEKFGSFDGVFPNSMGFDKIPHVPLLHFSVFSEDSVAEHSPKLAIAAVRIGVPMCGDTESPYVDCRYASFKADHGYLQNGDTFKPLSVNNGIAVVSAHPNQRRKVLNGSVSKGQDALFGSLVAVEHGNSDFESIKIAMEGKTSGSDKSAPRPSDFASGSSGTKYSVDAYVAQLAVGGQNDTVRGGLDVNRRAVSSKGTGENQADHPVYIRRNDQRFISSSKDAAGAYVEEVSYHDIDISYDGKTWFHLLGKTCLKGVPRLIITEPVDRVSSTRNP